MSGEALAAGFPRMNLELETDAAVDHFPLALFITWTTYGTWLPGDRRGWRNRKRGFQFPQPLLEDWCREQMKESPILLTSTQQTIVEQVIRDHAQLRGWTIHAISVRSNHVHVVVSAAAMPKTVRDQFKANATRVLRAIPKPIANEKVWTKGGDIEFIDTDDDLERVIVYVNEAQDRMDRGK